MSLKKSSHDFIITSLKREITTYDDIFILNRRDLWPYGVPPRQVFKFKQKNNELVL